MFPPSHGSRICHHSFPIFPPIFSPIFSPISPIPLPSLQQDLSFSFALQMLYPRIQNSAHHEHQAGKRMLERTESRRADRGSPKGWALRASTIPIDPDTESYITFNPAETLPAGNFAILSVLDNGFVISGVMGNDLASVLPTVRPQRYLPN